MGFRVNPYKGNLGAALISQKWGLSGVTDPCIGHGLSHRVPLSLAGVWALQLKRFVSCLSRCGPCRKGPSGSLPALSRFPSEGKGCQVRVDSGWNTAAFIRDG